MASPTKAKMELDYLPSDQSWVGRRPKDEDECRTRDVDSDRYTNESSNSGESLSILYDSGISIVPTSPPSSLPISISEDLLAIECSLCEKLDGIKFPPPVEYVYNPIKYAFDVHANYVRKFCRTTKKIIFLGMNPGPWGMTQTGVPFGEINAVRDWLQVSGIVDKPSREQPDRKVTGFACKRSEVSGRRLWGLFKDLCDSPENFFRDSYVHNYCPLALMDFKGRNITPAELKGSAKKNLHDVCDEALAATIKLLRADIVVGIGRFAEKRAQTVVKTAGFTTKVVSIPHPSPRASGNQNWSDKAMQGLEELNLLIHFTK